ncbi:MAG: hypothetical protein KY455_03780 [Euryarchaeota archaeon]|nr:hypothetical protein [Euryarchaeota archaeon]
MGPARPSLLVTAAILVLSLMVPTGVGARSDEPPFAHIQGIAEGDLWTFRVTGNARGEVHNEVAATEVHEAADGARYETFRIHSSSDLVVKKEAGTDAASTSSEVEEHVEIDKWIRTTDHATLGLSGTTTLQEQGRSTFSQDVQRTYRPVLVEEIFPFTVGYEWASTVKVWQKNGDQPEREPWQAVHTVQVVDHGPVSVQAGTFQAWKMLVRFEGVSYVRWYAEEACTTVKELRYGKEAARDGKLEEHEAETVQELVAFRCSRTPMEDPVYSTDEVRLLAVPPGMTGGAGSPAFEDADGDGSKGSSAGLWFALAAVAAVASIVVGYRRARRDD